MTCLQAAQRLVERAERVVLNVRRDCTAHPTIQDAAAYQEFVGALADMRMVLQKSHYEEAS